MITTNNNLLIKIANGKSRKILGKSENLGKSQNSNLTISCHFMIVVSYNEGFAVKPPPFLPKNGCHIENYVQDHFGVRSEAAVQSV